METELTIEQKNGYLHARVTGRNTPETILQYLKEVHAACIKQQCRRILIEERLEGPRLSITHLFDVVTKAVENAASTIHCVAFVDTHPEQDLKRLQFGETVAVNRGVNVRLFSNVAEAEAWLQEICSND